MIPDFGPSRLNWEGKVSSHIALGTGASGLVRVGRIRDRLGRTGTGHGRLPQTYSAAMHHSVFSFF